MEYNFGDAEVVTLLLFILTLPFAMERAKECHPERSEGSPMPSDFPDEIPRKTRDDPRGRIATSPHKRRLLAMTRSGMVGKGLLRPAFGGPRNDNMLKN